MYSFLTVDNIIFLFLMTSQFRGQRLNFFQPGRGGLTTRRKLKHGVYLHTSKITSDYNKHPADHNRPIMNFWWWNDLHFSGPDPVFSTVLRVCLWGVWGMFSMGGWDLGPVSHFQARSVQLWLNKRSPFVHLNEASPVEQTQTLVMCQTNWKLFTFCHK